MNRKASLILLTILLIPIISMAQKELSPGDVQNFFKLIKQTTEYKNLKSAVDSFNARTDDKGIPQELNIEMLKLEENADPDDHIFDAIVERKLAVGFGLEKYRFKYNKQKKQIISIELVYKRNYELH